MSEYRPIQPARPGGEPTFAEQFPPPSSGQQVPAGYGPPVYAQPGYGPPPPQVGAPAYGYLPAPLPSHGQPGYGQGYGRPVRQLPPGFELASPWLRLGESLLNLLLAILTLGIGYLIWALILWQRGQNPGKQILGLKVIDANTFQTAEFGRMALRNFVFGFLVFGLGGQLTLGILNLVDALFIFGDKNQRLLDRAASTLVVRV